MAETVGSLIDKICIIHLKCYHMGEQAGRDDVPDAFRDTCNAKLAALHEQHHALVAELSELAKNPPPPFPQFKMYNDPQYRRTEPDA